jgi:hypothetical protein
VRASASAKRIHPRQKKRRPSRSEEREGLADPLFVSVLQTRKTGLPKGAETTPAIKKRKTAREFNEFSLKDSLFGQTQAQHTGRIIYYFRAWGGREGGKGLGGGSAVS